MPCSPSKFHMRRPFRLPVKGILKLSDAKLNVSLKRLKVIFDQRQVISTLFDGFSSFIDTDVNLNLQKFMKSRYLYEFDRKQIILLEKKRYEYCCAMHMVVSILGVQFKSKHVREDKKALILQEFST